MFVAAMVTTGCTHETGQNIDVVVFDEARIIDVELTVSEDARAELFDTPDTETYVSANLTFDGVDAGEIGLRLKGNSSFKFTQQMGSDRFSFKLDLNLFESNKQLGGFSKLNLNNEFGDPSYMRERLMYGYMREFGVPASFATHVNVFINGERWGLYTLVEQVNRGFLGDNLGDNDGDLYKPEFRTGSLAYAGDSMVFYPSANLKTNEGATDHKDFLHFVNALNNTALSDREAVYGDLFDVDTFLRFLALSTLVSNLDSYQGPGHNYYIYFDSVTGKMTLIPWDLNESFGRFRCRNVTDVVTFSIDNPVCDVPEGRPLVTNVLEVPAYRARYEAYLAEALVMMDPARVAADVESTAALIRESVYADTNAFFSPDEFELGLNEGAYVDGVWKFPGLNAFMEQRAAFVNANL